MVYGISYISSKNGEKWYIASDKAGIGVSRAVRDSEMLEYPFIFDHASS